MESELNGAGGNSSPTVMGLMAGAFLVLLILTPEHVWARDLESAARSYAGSVKTIGQISAAAGITVGGIMLAIPGANHFGKQVIAGGLVGALCSFAAPAFIGFLTTVFGG